MLKKEDMPLLVELLTILKKHKVARFCHQEMVIDLSPHAFIDQTQAAGHNGPISDIPEDEANEEEILYHSVR